MQSGLTAQVSDARHARCLRDGYANQRNAHRRVAEMATTRGRDLREEGQRLVPADAMPQAN
jgi:hypothetical protein